jgi:hypothetical protein
MTAENDRVGIPERVEQLERQVAALKESLPTIFSSIEQMAFHDASGDDYRVALSDAYGPLTERNSVCALSYVEGPLNHRDAYVGCFLVDGKWMFAVRNIGGTRIIARVSKLRFRK